MRSPRFSLPVAFALPIVVGALLAAPASAERTTYRGAFHCDDRGAVKPLEGMNVELWKRGEDWLPVEWVGRRVAQEFTRADGSFRMVTPPDEDNYFVRMALRDAHGVHLRDFWGINDWSIDIEQKRNNRPAHDYGDLVFVTPGQSHKCAIWAGIHEANETFRAETGTELPTRGVEIQADAITGGTPFTPGTSILWPGGYRVGPDPGDDATTEHEYAHAMRHGMDGDFGHFIGDAATFDYARNHEACSRTNQGFAFNEGWAEFWARRFGPAPDCGRPGDMETEGNVAAALTELMENCAGGQRKLMVETLRANPLRIHSFDEFKALFGCPVPKLTPVFVVAANTELAPPPPPPTITSAAARKEARSASKAIAGLQTKLKAAIRKAENPPTCDKEPCKAALKTLTRPEVLRFEIALQKIQRGAADDYDTAAEQVKLAGLGIEQLLRRDAKLEQRMRKRVAEASAVGVLRTIEAAEPVFERDSSSYARELRADLRGSLAKFRRAARKGAKLPGSLVLSPQASGILPRRLPQVPQTPQTPVPGPTLQPLAATGLAFTLCPANVASPKPIEVEGSLSPAQAGTTVTVTFGHPAVGKVPVLAITDAAGSWKASHTPGINETGKWTVEASFSGDAKRLPSSATPCEVVYQ